MENKQTLDFEFSEIDLESIFLSNAQSKGKRTSRSSILKQTKLMNVDFCETEDFDGRRKSQNAKRVSFADTFQVKELNTGNIYDIPGRNVLESSKESTLSIQHSNCSDSVDKENINPSNFMRLSSTESTRQFNSKLCTISHKQVDEEKENLSESMILPDAVEHLPQSSTPYMYNNKWAEIANPQDMDITIIQSKESAPFDEGNCHKTTEQSNSKLFTISQKQVDEENENLSLSESVILPDAVKHLPQSSTPYMHINKWTEIANPQDMDITIIQSEESVPFDEEKGHETCEIITSVSCITHSVQQSRLESVTPEKKIFFSEISKPEIKMPPDSNCIGYENYLTNEKLMMAPIAKHCQKNSFRISSDNLASPFEDSVFQSPFQSDVLSNFKLKAPVNVLKTENIVNNKCAANIEDVKDIFNPCVLEKRHFNLSLGFNNIHHMFEKNDYTNLNKENMPLIALRENNFESSRTFEHPETLQRLSDINNKKNMIKSVATNVLNKTKNDSEMDYTMLVANGMELTCHSVLQKQFQSGTFVDEEQNGQNISIPEQINSKESNVDSNISKICNFENSIPVSFSSQVMVSSTDLNHKKVAIITKEQLKQITHKTPDVVYSIRKMKKIKLNNENIINNESLKNKHTKKDFPNQNFHPVTKCLFPEPVMTNKITQSLKLFSQSPKKGQNCSNDVIPLSISTESTIYNQGIVQKEDIKETTKSLCHPNVDISELNILQTPNQGIKLTSEKDSSIPSDPIENVKDLSHCPTTEKTDPKDPVVAVRNFNLNKQGPMLCSKLSSEVSTNSDNLSLKENNDLKVLQHPSQNFESNTREVKKLCIPETIEDVPDSSTIYFAKENTGSSCLHDSVQSTLSTIRHTPTSNPLDATKVIMPKTCDATYGPSGFSCGEEKNSNNLLYEGNEAKTNGKNDSRIKADSLQDAKDISKVDMNDNDDISEVPSNNFKTQLCFEEINSKSSPFKAERELSFNELKDINKLDADCRNSEISPNDENMCLEKTYSIQNVIEVEIELPFKKANITKTSTEENNAIAHLCLEKREDSKLNIPETELECSIIDLNDNVNPKSTSNGNEKLPQSPTVQSLKSYQPIIYPSHLPTEEKPEPINNSNVSIETDLEKSFAEEKNISLEELQKKFVQASEGKNCRWKLKTLDSNGGVFKLTWGPWLFKCSLLIYIQQENSNECSVVFRKENDESDRYTDLGYKVFEYLVQEKTIPCSIFCDKIILKLTEYSSIALKAEALMRDILRISLSFSYTVSDLNPFKISVDILNDKHKSFYIVSFSINLITYPDEKIEPEIEHKLLKDVTNEVRQAVSLVEPGKNYLWNMVEAAEAI